MDQYIGFIEHIFDIVMSLVKVGINALVFNIINVNPFMILNSMFLYFFLDKELFITPVVNDRQYTIYVKFLLYLLFFQDIYTTEV